ncbi:hypothetical protein ASZ78_011499 [Callipepla squamata]|uniref:Uncharacterized protein n=1 Tax=Callipepla squamata TaxID=9009 RepID=A0A226NDI9_CALSU|nr:hypothetical protein ASZ78_011499 [Callipepla squamata]
MSDVLAAAAGSRFEPPAAGAPGGFSGAELSSEDEAAARRTEPAERRGDGSERSASPCGSQNGSPVRADATEDSKEDSCTLEDQKVAEAEEKLPDQIQSTEEVDVSDV